MRKTKKFEVRVEKIAIPDEELRNWVKTLYEGGFTIAEIEPILEKLSPSCRNYDQKAIDAVCDFFAELFEKDINDADMPPDVEERIRANLREAMKKEGIKDAEVE